MRSGQSKLLFRRISYGLVIAATAIAGCGAEHVAAGHGPGVALCVAMIEAHVETPRVLDVTERPALGEARIRFVPRREASDASVATCQWQRTATGGLRLASVAIDGRPLSDLELLVRNADLLLEDLRDVERHGPRS